MAGNQKGGGGEDDVDRYRQESEAKESAQLARAGKAKIAFEKVKPTARAEADQAAALAKAPPKDIPMEDPPTGDSVFRTRLEHQTIGDQTRKNADDEGEDDGEGDQGKSGSGGKSGGGPSPDLAPDAESGYVSFADGAETKMDKAETKLQQKAEAERAKAEGPDQKADISVQQGPATTQGAPKGTTAPVSSGKTGGPGTSGPSGGAKGGAGPGKSGGPTASPS